MDGAYSVNCKNSITITGIHWFTNASAWHQVHNSIEERQTLLQRHLQLDDLTVRRCHVHGDGNDIVSDTFRVFAIKCDLVDSRDRGVSGA
ncbi:hypothetical protein VNO78_13039 [Psophocarpus tetragonolobus]|uniref:Uncharacterized protein n=1 Tax=Psophocarpus tetragonolobus TaxID=3891 RepID=A0AAN9SNQ8_PSOTE